ncbi:hypothetical protein AB9K41_18445, partial [Cribrihabitans sp. XS_ASV171]
QDTLPTMDTDATADAEGATDGAGEAMPTMETSLGAELLRTFREEDLLTVQGFDYDRMANAVENSELADGTKEEVMAVLRDIRENPGTFLDKSAELREILAN